MSRFTARPTEWRIRRLVKEWRGGRDASDAASFRTGRIWSAVMTSVGSKVATVLFQLLAIPIAVNALGPAEYGAFLIVSSILAWIALGGLGVAPGVTSSVAAAFGRGDMTRAREFVTTGLLVSLGAAAVTSAVVAILVVGLAADGQALGGFFDPSFEPYLGMMLPTALVVGVTGLIQFPTSVLQAARAGVLEQHISNAWRMVGTGVGVTSMLAVAVWSPTMVAFAAAIAAPVVVGGVLDSLSFLRRHRQLRPRMSSFRTHLISPLVRTGAGFLAFSAGGFLITGMSLVIASSSVPPASLTPVGILFQLEALGVGLVTMVAIPLWPSVAHAHAASDREWVLRAYRRLRHLTLGVGIAGAAAIVAVLPAVSRPVFGPAVSFDPLITVPFAALFILACWALLHSYVLFGLGSSLVVGIVTVAQGALGLVILSLTLETLGAGAVGVSSVVAALTVTSWALPVMLVRRLSLPAS